MKTKPPTNTVAATDGQGGEEELYSPWPSTPEDALLLREIIRDLCRLKHGDPTARKRVVTNLNHFLGLEAGALPVMSGACSRFVN